MHVLSASYFGNYRVSLARAKDTARAFEERHLGALLSGDRAFAQRVSSLIDAPPPHVRRNVRIAGRLGIPGSGKSFVYTEALRRLQLYYPDEELYTVIVANGTLRKQVLQRLGSPPGKGYRVKTYEKALVEPIRGIVLFDDAGDTPPILDLFLLLQPCTHVYFTGDSAQRTSALSYMCAGSGGSRSPLNLMLRGAGVYLDEGRRLAMGTSASLGLRTLSTRAGSFHFGNIQRGPVLVGTPGQAALYSSLGRQAVAIESCQGLDFHGPYTIHLGPQAIHYSDAIVFTILTRGDSDIYIVHDQGKFANLRRAFSPVMRALADFALTGSDVGLRTAVRNHRMRTLPPHLLDPLRYPGSPIPPLDEVLPDPTLAGCGSVQDYVLARLAAIRPASNHQPDFLGEWYYGRGDFSDATFESAMAIAPHFATVHEEFRFASIAPPVRPPPPPPRAPEDVPHLLVRDLDFVPTHSLFTNPEAVSELVGGVCPEAKLDGRERVLKWGTTAQVNTADLATGVFLRHRRLDRVTEARTYKERYVPCPSRLSLTYMGAGQALFDAFIRVYNPARVPWNPEVHEQCVVEDLAALTAKGLKALVNTSYRFEPSLDIQKAEVFLKAQDVTKLGSQFRQAKKGQMVTGFCAVVNARFGPMTRMLYAMLRMSMPPEILLLNGLTLDELENWFAAHWDFSRPAFDDDIEGFDGGQNEDFSHFQTLVAHFYSVPPPMWAEYQRFTAHILVLGKRSRFWIPSGLKPTWLFNTIDNMANQALKYDLTPHPPWTGCSAGRSRGVARGFSGDDATHNEVVVIRPQYLRLDHRFRLRSTGGQELVPHFCGVIASPAGIYADPKLLLLRVLYKLRAGKLPASILGYAEHCYRLHRNLELQARYLTTPELAAHAKTWRVLRKGLLRYGIPLTYGYFLKNVRHTFSLDTPKVQDNPDTHKHGSLGDDSSQQPAPRGFWARLWCWLFGRT
jgi:hypothetical protein